MAADGNQLIGSIMIFAGNFVPRSWAYCDGQLLAINANQALFSLLGTTYGGDGRTTFALPDLRGRTPLGPRTGPGLSTYTLGERGGVERVALTLPQIPSHNHLATATQPAGSSAPINATAVLHAGSTGASNDPTGRYLANSGNIGPNTINVYGGTKDIVMANDAVTVTGTADLSSATPPTVSVFDNGGSQYQTNVQPFLAVNYIIALTGIYPSRS